jgi:hypothetical protein
MTYIEHNGTVILEMTAEDYATLMIALGFALGSAADDSRTFWTLIHFVNELNRTNPNFTGYAIPADAAALIRRGQHDQTPV